MLKRTFIGLISGLLVATTAIAGDPQNNMMMPGMGSGMGPGMMGRNMGPGMNPGMGQRNNPMMHGMHKPQNPGPFAGVQFNEKQQKMIREMMQKERESNQQRVEAMKAAQAKLQKIYMSEKWDVAAINKVYDEIFAEQKKTIESMAKARNEVYELMTKEQKEQMKKVQAAQQERMKQMREMRQQRIEQMRNRQQQPAAQK